MKVGFKRNFHFLGLVRDRYMPKDVTWKMILKRKMIV